MRRADWLDFRFHDLRHSFVSELAMGGASLAGIGELLVHRDLSTTRRYSHLNQGHLKGLVVKMHWNKPSHPS